jgi:hypothetical protein
MKQEYCPNCDEQNCYENGVCSKCNFTTQDPNDLRCCFCGGEVKIHSPYPGWSHDCETSEAEDSIPKCVPECMESGCLPEAKGINDVPQPTREDTIITYMELCKTQDI